MRPCAKHNSQSIALRENIEKQNYRAGFLKSQGVYESLGDLVKTQILNQEIQSELISSAPYKLLYNSNFAVYR